MSGKTEYFMPDGKLLASTGLVNDKLEINASNMKDLVGQQKKIADMMSSGKILAEKRKDHAVLIEAAFDDAVDGPKENLKVLAAIVTEEVLTVTERDGIARQFLFANNITHKDVYRVRIRHFHGKAMVATGISSTPEQADYDRREYIFPPRYDVTARPMVSFDKVAESPEDIITEMFDEAITSTMVAEDKLFLRMAREVSGYTNKVLNYVEPSLRLFYSMIYKITQWGNPINGLLMGSDIWLQIATSEEFLKNLDPVTQFEVLRTGRLGTLFGANLYTDAFRKSDFKVLDDGEIYGFAQPEYVGTLTNIGDMDSVPVDGRIWQDPQDKRGFNMKQVEGMVLANTQAVSYGRKI